MSIEIKKFKYGENNKLFNIFLKLPRKIYKGDPNWVPEWLIERKIFHNPKHNTSLKRIDVTYFVAFLDNKPVGRITAHIVHAHNEYHNEKVGFFGFFESIDNQDVANALLAAATEEIKTAGMDEIRGPSNFTSNEEYAMQIDGQWDSPRVMMLYNPKYYIQLMENAGFVKAMDMYAYRVLPEDWPNPKIQRVSKLVQKRHNVTLRQIKTKKKYFREEVDLLRDVYNGAWEKNWGFVPLNEEEFEHAAEGLRSMMNPKFAYVAEVDGKAVAFSITFMDLHQMLQKTKGRTLGMLWHMFFRKSYIRHRGVIDRIRITLLGVIKKYRRQGLEAMFFEKNFLTAINQKIKEGEMSWILENNVDMINSAKMMNAIPYKTYRIWTKPLDK